MTNAEKYFDHILYKFTEMTGIPIIHTENRSTAKSIWEIENGITVEKSTSSKKRSSDNISVSNSTSKLVDVVDHHYSLDVDHNGVTAKSEIENGIAVEKSTSSKERSSDNTSASNSTSNLIDEVGNHGSLDDVDQNGVTLRNIKFIVKSRGSFLRNRHLFY